MKFSRRMYQFFVWLFVVGVLVQTYFAGMVVVAGLSGWDNHVSLGHGLGIPLLIMIVTMFVGNIPGEMKRLTWLLFVVYILQADIVIFMRDSNPLSSAIHPVLALIDFALGWKLGIEANKVVQAESSSEN